MKTYKVLGIMSGSSMDGLDLALCEFGNDNNTWTYKIIAAKTYEYDDKWRVRLSQLRKESTISYVKTDVFYAHFIAEKVKEFNAEFSVQPDLIASHGHTVFHYPRIKITAQVGDGSSLSALTGIPVVSDFRRMDMALNGQGAPLVTIGDQLLFNEYDMCLNLGGFANISGSKNGKPISFDICACNILLNRIARDFGKDYDHNGEIAEKGSVNYQLLEQLNNIPYYALPYPKSLNRDWINKELWHIVREFKEISNEDKMKTLVDHIASQIANSINEIAENNGAETKILVTGGSAFNATLIDYIKTHTEAELIIPDEMTINYKESLIFGLLGLLRVLNQTNSLGESTGAIADSIAGGLHGNFSKLMS
jgi:anhydro-N-acetylmuramic acid kinase